MCPEKQYRYWYLPPQEYEYVPDQVAVNRKFSYMFLIGRSVFCRNSHRYLVPGYLVLVLVLVQGTWYLVLVHQKESRLPVLPVIGLALFHVYHLDSASSQHACWLPPLQEGRRSNNQLDEFFYTNCAHLLCFLVPVDLLTTVGTR